MRSFREKLLSCSVRAGRVGWVLTAPKCWVLGVRRWESVRMCEGRQRFCGSFDSLRFALLSEQVGWTKNIQKKSVLKTAFVSFFVKEYMYSLDRTLCVLKSERLTLAPAPARSARSTTSRRKTRSWSTRTRPAWSCWSPWTRPPPWPRTSRPSSRYPTTFMWFKYGGLGLRSASVLCRPFRRQNKDEQQHVVVVSRRVEPRKRT